jgi:FtsH-binding integral membrane protein
MSVAHVTAPVVSGPSEARLAFLRKVGIYTFVGLTLTALVAIVSTFTVVPLLLRVPFGAMIGVFGAFLFSHILCRQMVFGSMKVPGFVLGMVGEGFSFGFLLFLTVFGFGDLAMAEGVGVVVKAMAITAASGAGLLAYVWFNKSDLSLVKAGLSVLGIPMLLLMVLQLFLPMGGTLGLILCAGFVLFSGAALLYKLHVVVHEMDEDMHIEAAFEITMALLVLLWNVISLLNRLRR